MLNFLFGMVFEYVIHTPLCLFVTYFYTFAMLTYFFIAYLIYRHLYFAIEKDRMDIANRILLTMTGFTIMLIINVS